MRALLDHKPSRHHCYDIRVLDGGETMGDDDARAALPRLIQSFLYCLLDETQSRIRKRIRSTKLFFCLSRSVFHLLTLCVES